MIFSRNSSIGGATSNQYRYIAYDLQIDLLKTWVSKWNTGLNSTYGNSSLPSGVQLSLSWFRGKAEETDNGPEGLFRRRKIFDEAAIVVGLLLLILPAVLLLIVLIPLLPSLLVLVRILRLLRRLEPCVAKHC